MNRAVHPFALCFFMLLLVALAGYASASDSIPISNSAAMNNPSAVSKDMKDAARVLILFFDSLHNKNYKKAVQVYGGDYSWLQSSMMDIPTDHAALLKETCTHLLDCRRTVKRIVKSEQASPREFKFLVEFIDENGRLFERSSCCGSDEDDKPPQSQFEFTVKKDQQGNMKVEDLPVYVP
jgi:hypothetical protein